MSDPRREVDPGGPNGVAARSSQTEGTGLAPWQKVVGIIGLLVILWIVIALFVGGGHTPPVQHGQVDMAPWAGASR